MGISLFPSLIFGHRLIFRPIVGEIYAMFKVLFVFAILLTLTGCANKSVKVEDPNAKEAQAAQEAKSDDAPKAEEAKADDKKADEAKPVEEKKADEAKPAEEASKAEESKPAEEASKAEESKPAEGKKADEAPNA